ncbi:MAG: hypothetical protein LBH55_04375 [Mycoplasmataceae bacterium]|jgi:hypothetical protein|nr:hypothetical protein [Mycoplasmataceae bacterium]
MKAIITKEEKKVPDYVIEDLFEKNSTIAFENRNILTSDHIDATYEELSEKLSSDDNIYVIKLDDYQYMISSPLIGLQPEREIKVYKKNGNEWGQYNLEYLKDEIDCTINIYVIAEQLSCIQNYVFKGTYAQCQKEMENTPSYGYGNDKHRIFHYEEYAQIQRDERLNDVDDYDDDDYDDDDYDDDDYDDAYETGVHESEYRYNGHTIKENDIKRLAQRYIKQYVESEQTDVNPIQAFIDGFFDAFGVVDDIKEIFKLYIEWYDVYMCRFGRKRLKE